ncbi:amidohydrolase family protein [Ferrovibrio terrae]|uniref:amidohydrolase family protein n=1 Tax=Ferrovibrio terrae TaxID=2594003 RepID=UPI0031379297
MMRLLSSVARGAALLCVAGVLVASIADAQPMRRQGGGMPQGEAPAGPPGGPGAPRGPEGQRPPEAPRGDVPRWVDTHVHLVSGVTNTTGDWVGAVRVAIADMDKNNIGTAIVMPTPQPPGRELYDIADFADAVRKHPGRFAFLGGGGTLNPMIHLSPDAETVDEATKKTFADIANGIIDAGALGFGEMSANHLSVADAHSYHRSRPDHPLFLLLVEIAARRNVVIDFHMDVVHEPMPTPQKLKDMSQRNPATLEPNLAQFEKLLAHERGARIVWAHAGIDHTGVLSVELIRRMMGAHPNLYMSIKALPQSPEPNAALAREGRLRPDWRKLIAEFPDRFVMGTDRFYGSSATGMAPGGRSIGQKASAGSIFMERTVPMTQAAQTLLSQLPPQLAQRVAVENVKAIYRLPN